MKAGGGQVDRPWNATAFGGFWENKELGAFWHFSRRCETMSTQACHVFSHCRPSKSMWMVPSIRRCAEARAERLISEEPFESLDSLGCVVSGCQATWMVLLRLQQVWTPHCSAGCLVHLRCRCVAWSRSHVWWCFRGIPNMKSSWNVWFGTQPRTLCDIFLFCRVGNLDGIHVKVTGATLPMQPEKARCKPRCLGMQQFSDC